MSSNVTYILPRPHIPSDQELRDMFDHGLNKIMGEIAERENNYVEAASLYQHQATILSRSGAPDFLVMEYQNKARKMGDLAFLERGYDFDD